MTDGTFEEIGSNEDEVVFGPPAVLVCGMTEEERATLATILERGGCGDFRIIACAEEMLGQTVGDALASSLQVTSEPLPAEKLPRAAVLSGMKGLQIQAVLDAWDPALLPRPILAGTTEENLAFPLGGLLRELLAEHREIQKARG